MFLAIREITTARGRFALIGGTVALITLLLVMLSGLTEGLSKQNTSALESLEKEYPYISFSTEDPSFSESAMHAGDIASDGIPLGAAQTKLEGHGGVAVLSLPAGTQIPGTDKTIPEQGVLLPDSIDAAETVTLGGTDFSVEGTVPETMYSHSAVVWASTESWQQISHAPKGVVSTAALYKHEVPGSVKVSKLSLIHI